jgi:hypothetical protein
MIGDSAKWITDNVATEPEATPASITLIDASLVASDSLSAWIFLRPYFSVRMFPGLHLKS